MSGEDVVFFVELIAALVAVLAGLVSVYAADLPSTERRRMVANKAASVAMVAVAVWAFLFFKVYRLWEGTW